MDIKEKSESDIIKLLYLYFDHHDITIRKNLLKKIVEKIPFGVHPLFYIENIRDTDIRFYLRVYEAETLDYEKLIYDFHIFSASPKDLLKGSFLVSRFSDSFYINFNDYKKSFFSLVHEFLKLYPDFSFQNPEVKFQKIVEFLYYIKGFHGNSEDYYNPNNSYLTKVLETKKGIPVSLAVLTIIFYEILKKLLESKMNQKLDFTIYGINMPGHFLLAFSSEKFFTYFDPFNFGNMITYDECCQFLIKNGMTVDPRIFYPATPVVIIQRMLRNLWNYYQNENQTKKSKTIEDVLKILNPIIQVEEKNYKL
ncbi:MAG: transglutaminase-like domain-containing protein [Leptospiraceae bacterium]|nr:transglutaminase-like domain-containing protein [Leptospiraceae bacterium]MDW7975436.1 transglutaminase-like domain-containing protein [Leptospiraceae bacterium]